jgi:hypothetical protein
MKESRAVRDAISLIEGNVSRGEDYEIKGNKLIIANNSVFDITTLVARRLIELGY